MARSTAIPAALVLPQPPEKYDAVDQRETRRLIQAATQRLFNWGAVTDVPGSVTALGGLTGAADELPYFTGVAAMALASLTPYARTIIACANAAAARTVLGLGSLAVLNAVTESEITLADVTTDNVSITKHGFTPKAPNDVTKFLNGSGAWSVPPSSLAPALGTFPTITGLVMRISAELSTVTKTTDSRVTQINDMVGSRNFTATNAQRPRYNPTAFNGLRPGLVFDGVGNKMFSTTTFSSVAQPISVVMVIENWGKTGANNFNLFRDSNNNIVVFNGGSNWSFFAGGTAVSSAAPFAQNQEAQLPGHEGAPCIMIAVFNGASSVLSNNGVEITGNPGTTQGLNGTLVIGGDNSSSICRLTLYEMLIYTHALTLSERQSLNTYYANACGITL